MIETSKATTRSTSTTNTPSSHSEGLHKYKNGPIYRSHIKPNTANKRKKPQLQKQLPGVPSYRYIRYSTVYQIDDLQHLLVSLCFGQAPHLRAQWGQSALLLHELANEKESGYACKLGIPVLYVVCVSTKSRCSQHESNDHTVAYDLCLQFLTGKLRMEACLQCAPQGKLPTSAMWK